MENSGKKKHSRSQEPTVVFCPACQRQRDGEPSGFVHLEGAYLNERGEEIRHFLQKEAERAAEDNPLARIMRWETDEKGRPTLATTTEHLAERLGHALDKAFKGEVRYDFSHENKLAHVYWRRDWPGLSLTLKAYFGYGELRVRFAMPCLRSKSPLLRFTFILCLDSSYKSRPARNSVRLSFRQSRSQAYKELG
jgi:hypothetical protein